MPGDEFSRKGLIVGAHKSPFFIVCVVGEAVTDTSPRQLRTEIEETIRSRNAEENKKRSADRRRNDTTHQPTKLLNDEAWTE